MEVNKCYHYIKNSKCFLFPAVLQENRHAAPKDSAISKSFSATFPVLFLSICQAPLLFPFSCSCCSWRSQPSCVYFAWTRPCRGDQTHKPAGEWAVREHQEDLRIQLPDLIFQLMDHCKASSAEPLLLWELGCLGTSHHCVAYLWSNHKGNHPWGT